MHKHERIIQKSKYDQVRGRLSRDCGKFANVHSQRNITKPLLASL